MASLQPAARRRRPFQGSSGHAGSRLAQLARGLTWLGSGKGAPGRRARPGARRCSPAASASAAAEPSRPPSSSGLAGWPSCVPLASWQAPSPPEPPSSPSSSGRQSRQACAAPHSAERTQDGEKPGDSVHRQEHIEDLPAALWTLGPASQSWRPWGRQDCSVWGSPPSPPRPLVSGPGLDCFSLWAEKVAFCVTDSLCGPGANVLFSAAG